MMTIQREPILGRHIQLLPVEQVHREAMRELLDCDPHIWDIYAVSGYQDHFPAFWELMTDALDRVSYGVWDICSGRLVGTSSFFQIDGRHRTLEIGYTWYAPDRRGTHINPETKLLMLDHAFKAGALRVQFGVDTRNARSRRAMAKIAYEEGVVRQHKITWTGHRRDTVLFSIIDSEWPKVAESLRARLPD